MAPSFASRERRRFDPEYLSFLRTIAKHVALARDRARRAKSSKSQPAY